MKIIIDLEKVDFCMWEALYKFLYETDILKNVELIKQEKNK